MDFFTEWISLLNGVMIITVAKRYLFFRNLSTMDFGKVEVKQVGRFPFQRLDLEDGFQVEGWGSPAKIIGGCGPLERVLRVVALY